MNPNITHRTSHHPHGTTSELQSTVFEHPINLSQHHGVTSKKILIGIGSTTIELSLPGCASVRVLTTRSATADAGEATGSRRPATWSPPRPRRTRSPPTSIGCVLHTYEQNENLITGKENLRSLRL
ncbi:putative VP3 [Pheasant-associated gyrovirus]|nr:putative VP3 [Pheasant-associated gyrovirus]